VTPWPPSREGGVRAWCGNCGGVRLWLWAHSTTV
jgi:hypothetical protein